MPALVAFLQRGGERLTSAALGVQGLLAAAFLLFILFTSNPFLRLDPAPFEGAGLNPLLQDPGLAMHPPMLYAGYVGLSASFSYAAAALMVGEEGWARAARPFMLIAWIALTCGIALGSWWAYYELGWGGFWFWDPVENASLMPWLVATALLHSALATERSGAFRTWTLLLAIAGFSLSLIGTFLVRSGVLSSVHAFATDPTRGFFIMVLIALRHRRRAGAVRLARAHACRAARRSTRSAAKPRCCSTMCFWWRPAPASLSARFIRWCWTPSTAPRFRWGRLITRSPSRRSSSRFCCWCRSGRGWAGGAAISRQRCALAGAGAGPGRGRGAGGAGCRQPAQRSPAPGAFAVAGWLIGASMLDVRKRKGARAAAFAAALAHAGLGVTLMGVAGTTLWRSEALDVLAPGRDHACGALHVALRRRDAGAGPQLSAPAAPISR